MELARLKEIGLDTDKGLAYCADDPEFYAEMLVEYTEEAAAAAADLERLFAAADWPGYGIKAHALKTMSRMIGAEDAAETAYELELAAKHGDAGKISGLHEGFIAGIRELTEQICGISGLK